MIKFLKNSLFLLSFLILNSCTLQTNVIKPMEDIRKSILKIESWERVGECNEKEMTCENYQLSATGSGAVVLYNNQKVVLTAAHICNQKTIIKEYEYYFKAIDRKNKEYIVSTIKYDNIADICILGSISGELEPGYIKISLKTPEYAEKSYNLGAPMGIIEGDMVPIFQGFFFGNARGAAYYSIPAIGGSSGSPILNAKGELIGMVHSVHYRFHHLTLSATYEQLWNFLKTEQNHTLIIRNSYPH
jgi:S1-C subfamily serine protease